MKKIKTCTICLFIFMGTVKCQNVGIGTTNPTTKLSIVTAITMAGWTHAGQYNGLDSIIVSEGIGRVSASIGTMTSHAIAGMRLIKYMGRSKN